MCEAFQALPANERQSKRKKKTTPNAAFDAPSSVSVTAPDTSAFGHSFQVLTDAKDPCKQIGASDSTATLHLPRGFTHLANMELQRLHKLGKPLRHFHRGILKRMATLDGRARGGATGTGGKGGGVRLEVFAVLEESQDDGEEGGWGGCIIM
jgi:hypothetical protein